ncbi:hypothetical protein KJ925_05185 [Patescibacteria group bacterium]|nr:hypothetical protein [Patescibacteria group bacterium]
MDNDKKKNHVVITLQIPTELNHLIRCAISVGIAVSKSSIIRKATSHYLDNVIDQEKKKRMIQLYQNMTNKQLPETISGDENTEEGIIYGDFKKKPLTVYLMTYTDKLLEAMVGAGMGSKSSVLAEALFYYYNNGIGQTERTLVGQIQSRRNKKLQPDPYNPINEENMKSPVQG